MAKARRTTYEEPAVRVSTTWTVASVRSARSLADSGNISRVAELCDEMLTDDRVSGVLGALAESLLGVDVGFDEGLRRGKRQRATDDDRSDVVIALEDDGDWWAITSEDEAKKFVIWGRLLGCSPGQLVYPDEPDPQRDGRVIPRLEFWHPKHLRYDTSSRKWFIRVSDGADEVEFTPGDGQWVLYAPGGMVRPWAQGIWRGLALWWLLKVYARDDLGNLGGNASRMAVTRKKSSTPDARKALASELFAAARNGVIVLPEEADAKLLGVGQGTKEVYELQVALADKAISISGVGQNLTTDVEGGSFAAARVHGQVRGQVIRSVGESFATFMHDQVLTWYAEINWGSRVLAPWPAFDTEPPEDLKEASTVLSTVVDTVVKARQSGIVLDLGELKLRFKVPFADKQPEPVPGAPQEAPAGQLQPGQEQPPNAPRVPAQPKQPPKALLSGEPIRNVAGFVEGQTYADALVDSGIRRGTDLMATTVADLLELVDGVESLDEAREKLLAYYDEAPLPDQLAEQCERLFMLAQLAGVAAVAQDAPEAKERPAQE